MINRGISVAVAEVEISGGEIFRVRAGSDIQTGMSVDLFLRPEAMLIQPDRALRNLNRFQVTVASILFDGANSRLLVIPVHSERELLVALPQNRQYEHIRPDEELEIGWDMNSGVCFAAP